MQTIGFIDGDTILTISCRIGHILIVRSLIYKSVDIHHKNKKGYTGFLLACKYGKEYGDKYGKNKSNDYIYILKMLIAAGYDYSVHKNDVYYKYFEDVIEAYVMSAKYEKMKCILR